MVLFSCMNLLYLLLPSSLSLSLSLLIFVSKILVRYFPQPRVPEGLVGEIPTDALLSLLASHLVFLLMQAAPLIISFASVLNSVPSV